MADNDGSQLRKGTQAVSIVETLHRKATVAKREPVRVKLERVNSELAKALPPGGEAEHEAWLGRLRVALGSPSTDFLNATIFQLQAAARLPSSGISETAVNAALALIESEQPKGEVQCALVIQMACVHSATMAVLGRLGGGHGGDRHVLATATAISRLSRTFAVLVETLRRLRTGGSQTIRIERIEIKHGGQAVIGNLDSKR